MFVPFFRHRPAPLKMDCGEQSVAPRDPIPGKSLEDVVRAAISAAHNTASSWGELARVRMSDGTWVLINYSIIRRRHDLD